MCGKQHPHVKEWNCYLTPYTKINSTCIKDLNVRVKIIKVARKCGGKFHNTEFGNNFLDMTPNAQPIKEKK